LFWNEHPTPKQYVGLCLIPVSILLCNYGWKKSPEQ
jgi:drug/metabolite transporter (DMT)-like permease